MTMTLSGTGGSSQTTNGYTNLPNGMILQWGQYTATMTHGTQYTATFPTAFTNSCFQVVLYVGQTASSTVTAITCPEVSHTTTGVTFQYGAINGGSYSTTVHYMAIGY